MKITLASISSRTSRTKHEITGRLFEDYIERIAYYLPCESKLFETEDSFINWLSHQHGRARAFSILLDSRGQQFTSEEFASRLGRLRDEGTQRVVLAVGPADGWSTQARESAALLFSLGRLTLPHQLARIIVAEQVYRANAILAGHPYHSGH